MVAMIGSPNAQPPDSLYETIVRIRVESNRDGSLESKKFSFFSFQVEVHVQLNT